MGPLRMIAATSTLGLALAGCGGERQDKNEPSGTFTVDVTHATFPHAQRLAEQSTMTIAVKNTGSKAVPDVAVTVDSFNRRATQPDLADPSRPVWIVDEGPVGGQTATTNTWALSGLRPGQTKTFRWKVTATAAGRFNVRYRVAAGLDGKAKAQTAGGGAPAGSFPVRVSDRPRRETVDPVTGQVVRQK